jgi:ApaG protein
MTNGMNTAVTKGVEITVHTQFREDLSSIENSQFFFNYRVVLENQNDFDIQLMSRDWYIFDSLSAPNFVSGEGVVGEQPVIKPGERYTYVSGSELFSELGLMKGFYTFQNLETKDSFQARIPTFSLIYPNRMN